MPVIYFILQTSRGEQTKREGGLPLSFLPSRILEISSFAIKNRCLLRRLAL